MGADNLACWAVRVNLNRSIAASAQPRVMKQVLLRITAVFAEIGFGKFTQPLRGYFLSTLKILLP